MISVNQDETQHGRKYDICGVGHITLDKVVTPRSVKHMPGGTSYYFSNAIRNMPLHYLLVTLLAKSEMKTVDALRKTGIEVNAYESAHSVYFENIYSENQDQRTQRVLQIADPFTEAQLKNIDARIFHLGPLLGSDMSAAFIKDLSTRGRISLDVQGLLRTVVNKQVILGDWSEKKEALKYVDILKANDEEMEMLTGCNDPRDGALLLSDWGVKEAVITLGSRGSVIYKDEVFYDIPAFIPDSITDATGCGDTYMAGYLTQRTFGKNPQYAGEFASAMAALKIETHGPFTGTAEDVFKFMALQTGNDIPVLDQSSKMTG
ncbi:MAG: PfkB family carbohydrate kinase [Bacteroidota bacterium]